MNAVDLRGVVIFLQDDPECVNDSWEVEHEAEEDVDEERTSAPVNVCHGQGGEE